MMHGLGRQLQLPIARVPHLLKAVALALLPAVEIADEENIQRMRRPLAKHPAVLRAVQPEVRVSVREIRETAAPARELVDFPHGMVMAAADGVLIGCQPFILCDQADMLFFSHFSKPLSLPRFAAVSSIS